jgi:Carboxypeptidase regulatory-like domain/TonB dependent receptor
MSKTNLVLAILFLTSGTLFGQVSGRLTGTVIDSTGSVVPDATVSLFLPGGKTALLTTKTDSTGIFDLISVRPELYTLVVERDGFAKNIMEQVKVDPARELALPPIELALEGTRQEVDVVSSAQAVDRTSAEIAATVAQTQVQSLPVLDRQIRNLFILEAGVSKTPNIPTVVNGMRSSYVNLTLDGIDVQDSQRSNAVDFVPNLITISQVKEFTVSTSNLSPTVGGAASTIALVTPSGTNELHGSAYWYNRNSYFAANDWFNNKNRVARPFLNLNQPGGTLGGPIIRDKLFFFANYEALRERQTLPKSQTILTPTARQGILQYRVGGAIQQFNVLTAAQVQPSPFIANLLSKVPADGNNNSLGDGLNTTGYTFNARNNETRDNVTGKVDFNLSPKHVFAATYAWNREISDFPQTGSFYTFIPPVYSPDHAQLLSASYRWTPLSTLTNELRGGYNFMPVTFINREKLPSYFVVGMLFSSPVQSNQIGSGHDTNYYRLEDNLHWVHGRQSVSFGFQTFQTRAKYYFAGGTIPTYIVGISSASPNGFNTGQIPGASSTDISRANSLLATLGGLLTDGNQTFNATSRTSGFVPGAPRVFNLSFNNYAAYVANDIKVRANLTLNLGLRWDYFLPVDEVNGLIVQPVPINNDAAQTLLANATLDFTGNAVGRPLYKKDRNNFAPRVGFAWDPLGDGKTAIRGGFNIAFLNDNAVYTAYLVGSTNNGLSVTRSISNLTSRADSPEPIQTPPFQIPVTSRSNFDVSPSAPPTQAMMDPNLVMPYVEQWNLSIQREVKGGFIVEGRYIGNHVVKIWRQLDFNQVNIFQEDFLQDFLRARNNGFLAQNAGLGFNPAYNAAIPGSQRLTLFPRLPNGGLLTNATVLSTIRTGEIGTLAQNYQSLLYFPFEGFSYFPNPFALSSAAVTNRSNSTYNAAQFEVRKRTHSGIQFQANYTFSKALTDTPSMLPNSTEAQLDNNNPRNERAPAPFDQRHAVKLNHYFPLPVGGGHRLHLSNPILSRVIEGWGLSGFLAFYSGNPVAIYSARGTLNRGARSSFNTVDTAYSIDQLRKLTGIFMTSNGPYWFNPANIAPNTQAVAPDGSAPFAGQVFFNPQPGSAGSLQRRVLNGPWYKNYDLSISKNLRIQERHSLSLRADFYNILNHPNFLISDQNVNSNGFGKFTAQYYTNNGLGGVGPRLVQFGLDYRF